LSKFPFPISERRWKRLPCIVKLEMFAKLSLHGIIGGTVDYTSYTDEEALRDLMGMICLLDEAKVFELPSEVWKLLLNTRNEVRPVRLPFPITFIEAPVVLHDIWHKVHGSFIRSKTTYFGFLLAESGLYNTKKGKVHVPQPPDSPEPTIYIYSIFQDEGGGFGHIKLNLYKDYPSLQYKPEEQKKWRREREIIREFIMNFLDFINDPDVEWVETKRVYSTSRRAMRKGRGKKRLSMIIKIRGFLKRYLEQVRTGRHFTYSHRFWVRGHWRHFRHERFTRMRGRRIWIPPFIKGSGILINKRYRLVKEK